MASKWGLMAARLAELMKIKRSRKLRSSCLHGSTEQNKQCQIYRKKMGYLTVAQGLSVKIDQRDAKARV